MKSPFIVLFLFIFILVACGKEDNPKVEPTQAPAQLMELRPQRPADLPTIKVKTVVDGDTLELEDGQTAQLIGISAPPAGDRLAEQATTFTRDLLSGKEVGLEAGAEAATAEGSPLFYVWVGDLLANYEIVRGGYANHLLSGSTAQYDGFIAKAEALAQAENSGVWQKSQFAVRIDFVIADPPEPDEENLNGEVVQLLNYGTEAVDLSGFTVRDSSNTTYTFEPETTLFSGEHLSLYSGCGFDTGLEFYWCSTQPIWNNTGDTVVLTDAAGMVVDHREISPSH